MRNVTELIVDDGQQADKGRKTRLNDVDGLVRAVKSAGRIVRLWRNKHSFRSLVTSNCAVFSQEEEEQQAPVWMTRQGFEVFA